MEHNVYICSWSQSASGYKLWVSSCPRLCGEAPTYQEAEERLIKAIQDAGGAMHAVMEFDRPLPKTVLEAKYTKPEIYLIGGDDRFETDSPAVMSPGSEAYEEEQLKYTNDYFQFPVCKKCKYAMSPRSEIPLTINYTPPRFDGAFGYAGRWGSTTIQLLSEDFIELLTEREKDHLQLRPVVRKRRGRRFYELLGPAGPPFIAVAGLECKGWRCTECGHRVWGYWIKDLSIDSFVAASDLPSPLPSLFTVGTVPEISLAVTAGRWKELVGKKGTRGFTSRLLGVVPGTEVIRCPELPTYEECLQGQSC